MVFWSPSRQGRVRREISSRAGRGIITPSSLHFATQHHYGISEINPGEHRLTIHGMVDRPMVFTVDELKRFPATSGIHFLECLGNRPRLSVAEFASFWNQTVPEIFQGRGSRFGHVNIIQPWRVAANGMVDNGLAT